MELRPVYVGAFAVGTALALLFLLRLVQRGRTPDHEGDDTNAARALLHAGQILAVFLIAAAAVKNCVAGESVLQDVLWVAAFGAVALALLMVTGLLGISLLIRSHLSVEIDRKNVAAGVAAGAHYVACGIVTAESFAGHDARSLGVSLIFFLLAQLTLLAFIALFRLLTTYDDPEEIRGENLAAALSHGGLAIAVALIVGRALAGDFVSWGVSLLGYARALAWVIALYPVRQVLVETLFLGAPLAFRGGKLDQAIQAKRSVGMGVTEAVSYLATALAVSRLYS